MCVNGGVRNLDWRQRDNQRNHGYKLQGSIRDYHQYDHMAEYLTYWYNEHSIMMEFAMFLLDFLSFSGRLHDLKKTLNQIKIFKYIVSR